MPFRTTFHSSLSKIVASFADGFWNAEFRQQKQKRMHGLISSTVVLVVVSLATVAQAQLPQPNLPANYNPFDCDEVNSGLCPETPWNRNDEGKYVGHDEPADVGQD